MIAHFVGGPLNGKERALGSSQRAVEVYELQQPTRLEWLQARGEDDDIPEPTVQTFHGEYRRVGYPSIDGAILDQMPVLYVWVDERPFRFVVTVDAYPGADQDAARHALEEAVRHTHEVRGAFAAGIKDAKVE